MSKSNILITIDTFNKAGKKCSGLELSFDKFNGLENLTIRYILKVINKDLKEYLPHLIESCLKQ